MNRTYLFNVFYTLIFGCSLTLHCQVESKTIGDSTLTHQLRLQHDNDFFTLSDRYYSSGLYLTYTTRLKKGIGMGQEQLSFTIGQEVYTPSDIITTNIDEQDRPYVGFTGLKAGWSSVKNKHSWDAGILLGIAGNNSGAGGFQRWYHKIFVVSDPPVWVTEMNNSLHANGYLGYLKEWTVAPNPFSITLSLQPSLAFGTRDQYAQANFIAYFGRRDPISTTMANQRIGSARREIFFSLRAGYRYVEYNALLEGNALGDDSIFLISPNRGLVYGGFDVQHRFEKNEYWFGYRIQSAEAPGTQSHKYVILSYARNF